jgi:hypothetical protein
MISTAGKSEHIEFIHPAPLVNTIERCLCRLVNDDRATPLDITNGLWFAAAILDTLDKPPITILTTPEEWTP